MAEDRIKKIILNQRSSWVTIRRESEKTYTRQGSSEVITRIVYRLGILVAKGIFTCYQSKTCLGMRTYTRIKGKRG